MLPCYSFSSFIDCCLFTGDPERINYTTVGAAVTTITSNLNDMTRGMRLMAALIDNPSDADNLMKVCIQTFCIETTAIN